MFKRIITVCVVFSMTFSLMINASAENISSQTTTNFWNALIHGGMNVADIWNAPVIGSFLSYLSSDTCAVSEDGWHHAESGVSNGNSLSCVCRYCSSTFEVDSDDLSGAYNNYVTDLNAEFGASFFGEDSQGQYLAMYLPTGINAEGGCMENVSTSDGLSLTASLRGTQVTASDAKCKITLPGFNSPVACQFMTVQLIGVSNFPNAPSITYPYKHYKAPITKGQFLYLSPAFSLSYYTEQSALPAELYFDYKILGRFYLPTSVSLSDVLDDLNSRPTSIIGDYGIIGDNGSIIKVDGNMIVDESSSTVYNPVTNTTLNYTDYAYDYSDRSYNLTLEDGSTMKVTYGDENVTINEGDTVYNIYYIVPEADQEDDGSGSGDTGDTDSSAGWAWLKGAWTQMMDKLSGILEAITDLELSPEINVDVEVGGEEQVTQESWFSDLLAKFGFLTSIHDIYTQLVADVTSDAATAAAVADGEVMLADVTSGHAAIDGRASYTAPELAISFGSSDKYGVDWAGIRPLNLSWYAPHKETVDGILSGILWLSYLFLLIKRAPGIIRGSEMVTEDSIKIDNWRMRH